MVVRPRIPISFRKRPIAFLIFLICLFAAYPSALQLARAGFSVERISSDLPSDPKWDLEHASEDLKTLEKALEKEYHFIGSGVQAYAFGSDDGEFVIKFFKHYRWRPTPFMRNFSFLSSVAKNLREREIKGPKIRESTFNSALLSYSAFKEVTGVIYVHLNKTDNLKKLLTIRDRIGSQYQIDLDKTSFILQRKGVTIASRLRDLRKKGDHNGAKTELNRIMGLIIKTREDGFHDRATNMIHNFGFIEGKPAEIDTGGFFVDQERDLSFFYEQEVFEILKRTMKWMKIHYPELSVYTKERLHEISEKRLSSSEITAEDQEIF